MYTAKRRPSKRSRRCSSGNEGNERPRRNRPEKSSEGAGAFNGKTVNARSLSDGEIDAPTSEELDMAHAAEAWRGTGPAKRGGKGRLCRSQIFKSEHRPRTEISKTRRRLPRRRKGCSSGTVYVERSIDSKP